MKNETTFEPAMNLVSGIWKFRESAGLPSIIEMAKDFQKREGYRDIHVRRCSKNQYGISFIYRYCDENCPPDLATTYRSEFVEEMTDCLKRRFGNDFAGWDLATEVWIPKKWQPLDRGTVIRTTQPNMALRKEWTDGAWEERKWGVTGKIIAHQSGHGLCYEVRHSDDTEAFYDPSELEVLS